MFSNGFLSSLKAVLGSEVHAFSEMAGYMFSSWESYAQFADLSPGPIGLGDCGRPPPSSFRFAVSGNPALAGNGGVGRFVLAARGRESSRWPS